MTRSDDPPLAHEDDPVLPGETGGDDHGGSSACGDEIIELMCDLDELTQPAQACPGLVDTQLRKENPEREPALHAGGVKGYEIRHILPNCWPPVQAVLPGEPHGLRNPLALWTYLDGVRTFVKGAPRPSQARIIHDVGATPTIRGTNGDSCSGVCRWQTHQRWGC